MYGSPHADVVRGSGLLVLLLPRPGVLEPDLGDALRESRLLSDALQVLSVRITVDTEVSVKDSKLFFGE